MPDRTAAIDVPCPECDAPAGRRCRSRLTGRPTVHLHPARVAAARALDDPERHVHPG